MLRAIVRYFIVIYTLFWYELVFFRSHDHLMDSYDAGIQQGNRGNRDEDCS